MVTLALTAACIGMWFVQKRRSPADLFGPVALNGPLVRKQPWRLVTHALAHGSQEHLAGNMASLLLFGWLLESDLGTPKFSALTLGSWAASTGAVLMFRPHEFTVGASGIIFGLFAGAVLRSKGELRYELIRDLVPSMVGSLPQFQRSGQAISWPGHFGGFLGGLIATPFLARFKRPKPRDLSRYGWTPVNPGSGSGLAASPARGDGRPSVQT